ncbi:hypothetical protein OHA40_09605 [Nocardia sp. NBC_00508]|uniref:hypothetical protein n=1 Tax=Nocardia sp. NBC_00508 TaxID=2975992 RepID=UPI002E816C0E|nr:hypothetical protein [Nocardia sp. NBC_00508]WUD68337.1 hypothetical protein OHA40_09605 [Nocardia sp. NBC_00508]
MPKNATSWLSAASQSVLASYDEGALPFEATASMEVDVAFLDDPDESKADMVDGAIGELSPFHETFGYYAQGVSVTTAVLPKAWSDRVVAYGTSGTEPGRGLCLEPHDCVISKLVAGRAKDHAFAAALVEQGLINLDILDARLAELDAHPLSLERIRDWIVAHRTR